MTGTLDALAYLQGIESVGQVTIADVRHLHHLMFKGVHPWAGQFRAMGQVVMIAGFPAADPQRIVRELELTLFQTRELLESGLSAHDPHQTLAALAFFHVRFERVHPFLDGNGRAGRAILAIQFEKVFGMLPEFKDQRGYREAIRASAGRDLAPLVNYLGESAGLPRVNAAWCPQFQISPRFLEQPFENPTFDEDVAWSRVVS